MIITHFFDPATSTLTYVLADPHSHDAVIIDPVLNFNAETGAMSTEALNILCTEIKERGLQVKMILETHAHADHLSSAQYLKKRYPQAQLAIGSGIAAVQRYARSLGTPLAAPQAPFDRLLAHNESLSAGTLSLRVLHSPGHTPACVSYLFGDAVFCGDALLMPDAGTGRCDFPGGSAADLYRSVHEILYALPATTRVFVGHDYQPQGRALAYCSSIKEQREKNIMLPFTLSAEEFIRAREARDRTLAPPRLLLPSICANVNGGALPPTDWH